MNRWQLREKEMKEKIRWRLKRRHRDVEGADGEDGEVVVEAGEDGEDLGGHRFPILLPFLQKREKLNSLRLEFLFNQLIN